MILGEPTAYPFSLCLRADRAEESHLRTEISNKEGQGAMAKKKKATGGRKNSVAETKKKSVRR